jgi:class 3 adenylate cyclase
MHSYMSSFQPKQVRDRLLAMETQKSENRKSDTLRPVNHTLTTFLNGNENVSHIDDKPIADFFPNCTVFFGDIAGFTAWSSTREPAQVFILLQTVYQNFDTIAKRRKVFKVETIGTLQ